MRPPEWAAGRDDEGGDKDNGETASFRNVTTKDHVSPPAERAHLAIFSATPKGSSSAAGRRPAEHPSPGRRLPCLASANAASRRRLRRRRPAALPRPWQLLPLRSSA